ncbi:MAG TPA: hypothetical protein RMH99_31730 [Sandaracinaceae bacterium LLY-WYZ-13_1]|nr:hypothetical protein [Sandaracinaceae bacterium LLY-WYZ-13_1]
MLRLHRLAPLALLASLVGCDGADPPLDAGTDAGAVDCPSLTEPQAMPGDDLGGDTWATFAEPFFADHCTRCHASTRSGTARRGAPETYDWDREAAVRTHLAAIRSAVGVTHVMPPGPPRPSCEERARLVRWIDADAP